MRSLAVVVHCLLSLTAGACALEVSEPLNEGVAVDGLDQVQTTAQGLWYNWGPLTNPDEADIVGIARTYNDDNMGDESERPYAWYTDGTVCKGHHNGNNLCAAEEYTYTAPGSFSSIRGVAIAADTSHVYAWYSDSTVSEGTSWNLSYYSGGKRSFARPVKPGGGLFSMSELVEADHNHNGWVYYFWLSGSTLYRTLGTSRNAEAHSSAQIVTWATSKTIRGISFDDWKIETWYSDGTKNSSSNSLNLAMNGL
jgi:hypothetical protein